MEENNYEEVTPGEIRKDPEYANISRADKSNPMSRQPKTLVRMVACLIALVVVVLILEIYIIYATLPKQPNAKSDETTTKSLDERVTSAPASIKTTEASTTPSGVTGPIPEPDGNLHVYALPIGQGDANVIQCPDGILSLVDFGSSNEDNERFWAQPELDEFLAGKKDLVQNIIITHQHWDHYRLLPDVFPTSAEISGVQNIYISCTASDLASTVADWISAVNGAGLLRTFNDGGQCGPLGGSCGTIDICPNNPEISLNVLAANLGQHCTDGGNKNMDSIVSKVEYGDFSLLLPGDFEDETSDWGEDGPQKWMSDFYGADLKVTVNHVSHHGASFLANKPVWRDAVAPKFTWASGDPWYSYGHPRCVVFDSFVNFVGTLCKPEISDISDPFYCGQHILDNPNLAEILQTAFTCGTSSTEFEYRTGNDFAIYTTTPDQTTKHLIDVGTDGTRYGIRYEVA